MTAVAGLAPFDEAAHHVEAGGLRWNVVVVVGHGPALLMLHGTGAPRLVSGLAKDRRAVRRFVDGTGSRTRRRPVPCAR